MESEKVVDILKFYGTVGKEIADLQAELNTLEDETYNNLNGISYDGMPKTTGKTADPTFHTVSHINPIIREEIAAAEKKLNKLSIIKREIETEISGLPYMERTVILMFYKNRIKWERIAERLHYSVRQCKNFRTLAVNKLSQRFETNKIIANFSFPK